MPKPPKVSQIERTKSSFTQLVLETKELSSELKELSDKLSTVEESLRRIGLNVSAWHQITGGHDDDSGYSWSRDIGYTRIRDQWRIALRERSRESDDRPEDDIRLFSDAPPWMCLEAASKIPDLLEELIDRTQETRKNIRTKNIEVGELASVIESMASEMSGR
jgi:hypothetical protein